MAATITEGGPNAAISPAMLIPDLLREHPEAREVFDRHGLRGCGGPLGPHETIHFFAQVHGVDESRLLAELNEAVHTRGNPATNGQSNAPGVADSIYRRFFVGGILVTLTAGATWGAWLLWNIALGGSFRAIGVDHINAHGEAQIFGWVGLFIMGFAYQAFPRIWQTQLVAPRLAAANFSIMLSGIILRTIGMASARAWNMALPLAMTGGGLEVASVLIFCAQIVLTFRRGEARFEPYVAFVIAALGWFIASSVMSVWHTWRTMAAVDVNALIWTIATYQFPLRDLQVHGLALFMILGVSLRMLQPMFVLPEVPRRNAWWAFGLLTTAVVSEVVLFLVFRWTGSRAVAMTLLGPWLAMVAAAALVVLPWKLWRPLPEPDRAFKFVRAAYGWLFVALIMLLIMPAYMAFAAQRIPGEMKLSHAYLGATRHAITVGFVSLMIMGMAAKVVPTLNGIDLRRLSSLIGPFLLMNVGCTLRVVTQILTDWFPSIFPLLGISGTLEVTGLAWWGLGLIGIIYRGRRDLGGGRVRGPAPERIEGAHFVGDVLEWFPETEEVLVARGFTFLKNPRMRQTVAQHVTLARAAAFRGVPQDELLDALNAAVRAKRAQEGRSGVGPALVVLNSIEG